MERPEQLLDRIESRDDFLHFLDTLRADYQAMDRREAKRDARLSEAPSWRAFAQLLLAGKGYE